MLHKLCAASETLQPAGTWKHPELSITACTRLFQAISHAFVSLSSPNNDTLTKACEIALGCLCKYTISHAFKTINQTIKQTTEGHCVQVNYGHMSSEQQQAL